MKKNADTLVVGGGASGMAAAITAARLGDQVILLEKSGQLGHKISASGNGRCNLMNTGPLRYYGDEDFAQQALYCCPRETIRTFLHSLGLLLTEETGGRVYPCSLQAETVVRAFRRELNRLNVQVFLSHPVTALTHDDTRSCCWLAGTPEQNFSASRIILAAGGSASPKLGGTGDGYNLLRSLGHRVIPPFAALTPLVTDSTSVAGLAGVRVHCAVSLWQENDCLHREKGEALFIEEGVSGICAMQCARFVHGTGTQRGKTWLEMDFSPALPDDTILEKELTFRRQRLGTEKAEFLLDGILPRKLSYAVCKQAGLPLRGEKIAALTEGQLRSVCFSFQHYRLRVLGTKGLEAAQVTAGGADCRSFAPTTMASRLLSGLHVTGELLNVDGDCGGFNLMFALASGILAGLGGRRAENAL